MKKTIENYVFPVCCGTKDGESDGCGVLVGNLFITAASCYHAGRHVIIAGHLDSLIRDDLGI